MTHRMGPSPARRLAAQATLVALLAPAAAAAAACAQAAQEDAAPQEADPLAEAWETFLAAGEATQADVVARVEQRIEALADEDVRTMLALRDRARAELEIEPAPPLAIYAKEVYAPAMKPRAFLPQDDARAKRTFAEVDAARDEKPFAARVRYDLGANQAYAGAELSPAARLWDALQGYVPGNDVLVAWLESRFDFDASMGRLADYFGHAYVDREGHAFPGVTLFDAFASQQVIEMPDTDAIAFAVEVLRDRSFRSPIPADRKRARLYADVKAGFARYFPYRTWIETVAHVYVNPEIALREEHEGLRRRVAFLCAIEGDDVERIRTRLVRAKTRDGFVEAMDLLRETRRAEHDRAIDPAADGGWFARRNAMRWQIALAARKVLADIGWLDE